MNKNNVKYLVVLGYTIYFFDSLEGAEEFFNNEPDAVELVGVRMVVWELFINLLIFKFIGGKNE